MSHSLGMFLILILLMVQVGLLGLNFISYSLRKIGTYYGSQPSGATSELIPLFRPSVSTQALLNWATLAATATLTLDFVNYQKNLADLKQYFTRDGYDSFIAALNEAGTIETIQSKKLVSSAVAIGPAIIIQEDEKRGIHSWRIQVPLSVSYLSASAEERTIRLITLLIRQVPTDYAATGIGIDQYQATELSSEVLRDII